jgi:hypothetical protein
LEEKTLILTNPNSVTCDFVERGGKRFREGKGNMRVTKLGRIFV